MSGTGSQKVPNLAVENADRVTSEQGETSTPVEASSTVTPYSVPVAGGYAYVCGTGHAHGTNGAAEQCGTVVAGQDGAPVVKVTLLGPAPYGGSYSSTQDDPTVARLIGEGWTVSRTWTVPADVWCDYCERDDHDTAGCTVADHDEYDQRYAPDNGIVRTVRTVRCTCAYLDHDRSTCGYPAGCTGCTCDITPHTAV